MPRRAVAVKVLVDDAINPEVLRTFNAEADILARLSAHPSIVTIFQASISGDGRPYFVMEYCPDSMSARYKTAPLPVADVLSTGVRMASALETAHRSGVLHRDIKPSNVLVTTLGTPVLADFGIAGALSRIEESPDVFAMSVPWSSPEVLQGEISGSVAAEVWSLGATLYTLLAGRSPFDSASRERIPRDQLQARIVKAKYIPTGRDDITMRVESALMRCLDKAPAKRYASMLELAEDLRMAQYELGMAPTALEVVDQAWANAALSEPAESDTPRGPVITTVRQDSRRAARAQTLASAQRVNAQLNAENSPRTSGNKAAFRGAAIGAGAVTAIALAILFATGVL
jgi:serine/threonine protein kinase